MGLWIGDWLLTRLGLGLACGQRLKQIGLIGMGIKIKVEKRPKH